MVWQQDVNRTTDRERGTASARERNRKPPRTKTRLAQTSVSRLIAHLSQNLTEKPGYVGSTQYKLPI